jgi:hypothetical protein
LKSNPSEAGLAADGGQKAKSPKGKTARPHFSPGRITNSCATVIMLLMESYSHFQHAGLRPCSKPMLLLYCMNDRFSTGFYFDGTNARTVFPRRVLIQRDERMYFQ